LGAVLCVFVAAASGPNLWFLVFGLVVICWDVFRLWAKKNARLGHRAVVRAVLAVASGIAFLSNSPDHGQSWVGIVAVVLTAGPVFFESLLAKGTNSKAVYAAHLPGARLYGPMSVVDKPLVTFSALVIACGVVFAAFGWSATGWLILAIVLGIGYLGVGLTAFARFRRNRLTKSQLGSLMADYSPEFYVYTSRPDDASYQIRMWLPYLEKTGKKYAVITRRDVPARALAEFTEAPVVTCRTSADLEQMLVPTLGAVFYVNASSGNGEMIRHQQYTHVYLGHGDSDKPPSYNPTHAMYDRIFAAGQAATERYGAHGVSILSEKFEIVGRPQLESVEVTTSLPRGGASTVLYAPTWRGHVDETMLHSLPVAPKIIAELIRRDKTVVFRPHPFSYEFAEDAEIIGQIQRLLEEDRTRSGRRHVFGEEAESNLDVIECMNLSDAMISDVSSVVSDYLYSGKPFAMTAVSAQGADFVAEYPIARASYVLNGDLSNLEDVLDSILVSDPDRQNRMKYRSYYLGDFPDDGYSGNFVAAASRAIENSSDGRLQNDPSEMSASDEDSEDENSVADDGDQESTEASSGDNLSRGFSQIYQKLSGSTLVPAGMSVLTVAMTMMFAPPIIVAISGLVGALSFFAVHRRRFRSRGRLAGILRASNAPRAVLAVSLTIFWTAYYETSWVINAAVAVLVVTIVAESGLAKSWKVTGLEARNLPEAETRGYQPIGRGMVAVLDTVVIAVGWALAMFGVGEYLILPLSAIPLVLLVLLFAAGLKRGVRSLRLDSELYEILYEYAPQFVVYFGSGVGITYQLGMWLPYFDRIGVKYIIVTRSLKMMRSAGQMTEHPVINRPTLRSLEEVITPSVGAAFYVNNAGKNTHFIERREMKHVWLNHGDSEKPACFNPVHAIYDVIFAAGQAGIDRYERHGVRIPRDKFRIVGRPQVERIHAAATRQDDIDASPTVLYAPTWRGAYQDSELYSLPKGTEIVQELIDRGCTVIFRAHPLNYRYGAAKKYIAEIQSLLAADVAVNGRQHLWGKAAESDMTTEDCFNASDAMISDVSAVITDYLQSGKPLSVVSVARTTEELLNEVPAAKAAYVLDEDLANLSEVLDGLLREDVKASERDQMRKYYLGDFSTDTYAEAFIDASRDMILSGQNLRAAGSDSQVEKGDDDE
jgi:CDP-glycerol glycerophosphotransferase (TagB/SpsB family)